MKTDAAVGITPLRAVFKVAFYRATDCRQLAAYLVMAACLKVHFQERIVLTLSQRLVGQDCLLGVLGAGFGNIGFVLRLVADEPVFKPCFRYLWLSLHYRPIGLFDLLMALEHGIEPRKRFGGAGKEDYPACRTIQPVRHTQKDLARLVVLGFDIRLDGFRQRCIAGFIALHDLVAGLVDGYNMIVFV